MDKQSIERINFLSRLAKTRELTPEESEERAELRMKYLAAFRQSFRNQLDATKVQYPDGTRLNLKDANKKK
ncbi:MAG: DUF896 domain-containing protein [Clostridia bacterium]|nr:DUF896 domain-containing protein [Clostridia bacterium]